MKNKKHNLIPAETPPVFADGIEVSAADYAKRSMALELVELIARMHHESEMEVGFVSEDAIATLNNLIESARQVTGIDPGYERYEES